jgi:AdoMet-dependent heme synthase
MKLEHKPRLIFWELTTGCNLRCVHCRASATELSSPDDLSTEEALGLIDQFAEYAPLILVLSGGEPLFRKDVFQLASYATSRGIKVALATNGTLVDEEVARKAKAAGIVRVAISLDGADAETHDGFRGIPGSFDRAIRGMRYLQAEGIGVQINSTVTKRNAGQLQLIYELALSLNAAALHTFLLVPVGCGLEIAESQMIPSDEYERLLNWFYDREKEAKIEMKATCSPHYYRVRRQRMAEDRRNGIEPPASFGASPHSRHPDLSAVTRGCLAGTGVCFVSHKGQVQPCGYLPLAAGQLREQTFRDVWENSTLFESLRDTDNLEGKCGCCEFRNVCEGCRARAYADTGNYLGEEPHCVYVPRQLTQIAAPVSHDFNTLGARENGIPLASV